MEMPADLTIFASSVKRTKGVRYSEVIVRKVGSVGMMIVGFIQITTIVNVELWVGKTRLEITLSVQVVDSGPARPGPAITFLTERMDSLMTR